MEVNNLFEQNEQITLESYLNKNGIDNIRKYLTAPTTVLDSCYIYDNIKECVNMIKYHILGNDKIGIVQDADMDGSCSSYMMYKYLKLHNVKKVKLFIQNGKERGIESDTMRSRILKWQPDLIIIPDAGTNSAQFEDELIDSGIDICVIDHHAPNEDMCKRSIVVNNLINHLECNTELSGTGVTFKVLQALDLEFNTKFSNNFIDLVGLSIISDNMNVKTYENRWFIKYLLDDKEHVDNPFIYELFDKILGDTYTQRDIGFKIIPLFNSVIRCGTLEDKQNLFLAFCGKNIDDTIKMCQNCHKKQIEIRDTFINNHMQEITDQADSKITIIDAKDVPQAFSGLIAGKISGMTNKPCIVGKSINGELGGSFRGYIPCSVMNTLPHVNKAVGHPNGAYGIFIDTSLDTHIADLRAVIDKMDISTIPTVVTSYRANKVPTGIFKEFTSHEDLWGKELDKPKFYVYNINVNSRDIKLMGKNQNTIKIILDGYEIMFFGLSTSQIESFKLGLDADLSINIIGTLNVNVWRGRKTNQIFVEDFEVTQLTDTFDDLM